MKIYLRSALFFVAIMLLPLANPALGQSGEKILILSQPMDTATEKEFVDIAPHLGPVLTESGRYEPVIYKAGLPAIGEAIRTGTLVADDLKSPLSRVSAQKIASVLGIQMVLFVSSQNSKLGLSTTTELQTSVAQGVWNTTYSDKYLPQKSQGRKPSLLESIHGHVDAIAASLKVTRSAPKQQNTPEIKNPDLSVKPDPNSTANPSAKVDTGVKPSDPARPQPKPSLVSVYDLVIERARRNGDIAGLITALRRAVNDKPRDIGLRRDLAKAYVDRGLTAMAREEVGRALELASGDALLHRLLGDIWKIMGDNSASLHEYNEAIRISPNDPLNHLVLGEAMLAAGLVDEAWAEFKAAVNQEPKIPQAFFKFARVGVQKAAWKESVAALATAKTITSPDDLPQFVPDIAAILTVAESIILEGLSKLQTSKGTFQNGVRTREETFKTVTAVRNQIDGLAGFLDAMPELGVTRIQALYAQAASMTVQSADKLLEFLELQATSLGDESNLLRIEAAHQTGEASKKLKAMLVARNAR